MLDVERSILDNMDYLKLLVKEIDKRDISDIGSNLLYEVAYASTYLDLVIDSSNDDKDLNKNLKDIKLVLDGVLSTVPKENVDKVKEGLDYKKLLKARYDNLDDACYYKTDKDTVLQRYLMNRLQAFTLWCLVAVGLLTGVPIKFFRLIANDSIAGEMFEIFDSLYRFSDFIFGFLAIILFTFSTLRIAIDVLYIVFPQFRDGIGLIYGGTLPRALKSTYSEVYEDGVVTYDKKRCYDRVGRNKAWLNTMLNALRENDSLTERDRGILKSLEEVNTKLEELTEKGRTGKEYYLTLAKVEILRDNYLNIERTKE